MPKLAIASGRSNVHLAENVKAVLDDKAEWVDAEITDFANDEIHVKYNSSLRGKDLFIFQSCNSNPNKDMMELLIMIHAAYLASARRITAVIPYIYGCRQDRKSESRTPITISLVADLLEVAHTDRIVTLSLHSPHSVATFKKTKIDNLSSSTIFEKTIRAIIRGNKDEWAIVSPDTGGIGRARYYSNKFGLPLAFANKYRPGKNKSEITDVIGDVNEKNCIVIDDIIDTGGTTIKIAEALSGADAKSIIVVATHLILSEKDGIKAEDKIQESVIEKVYATDSIFTESSLPDKFEIISTAELIADVVLRIHEDRSVGVLFEKFVR